MTASQECQEISAVTFPGEIGAKLPQFRSPAIVPGFARG
jgi:hypothetical protein